MLMSSIAAGIKKYVPQAVTVNQSNYLTCTGQGGITDSNTGTFSCWFKFNGTRTGSYLHRVIFSNHLQLHDWFPATDLRIAFATSANALLARWQIALASNNTAWHHVIMSANISSGLRHCYFDDVALGAPANTGTGLIGFSEFNTKDAVGIGWSGTTITTDMAAVYISKDYIDITNTTQRRKFITANKTPVSLGSNGSLPTGNQPLVYFDGDASVWNSYQNKGSVTAWSKVGTITNSVNEPVKVP